MDPLPNLARKENSWRKIASLPPTCSSAFAYQWLEKHMFIGRLLLDKFHSFSSACGAALLLSKSYLQLWGMLNDTTITGSAIEGATPFCHEYFDVTVTVSTNKIVTNTRAEHADL